MSLFERPEYQWRETFFVLFDAKHRPAAEDVKKEIQSLNSRLEMTDLRTSEDGSFESVTVFAEDDFAAMDISCVRGLEVSEQIPDLVDQLQSNCDSDEDREQLERIHGSTARLDVFHFERQASAGDEEIDFMDPGALLIVLEGLAELVDGVVVDPQSASLL